MVPKNLVKGKLITIYKNGPKEDPNNYRPIVLMNCITKLFSSIPAIHLRQWQEMLQILTNEWLEFDISRPAYIKFLLYHP